MTDQIVQVVDEVLSHLARAKKIDPKSEPGLIVSSSLDQVRLLVSIEERIDSVLDDASLASLDLSSREALVASVNRMIEGTRA